MNKSVCVLIPTYNEKSNIRILLLKLLKKNINEIIVIDDGSIDGTVDEILKIKEFDKRIKLLQRGKKLGIGSAYIDGFFLSNSNLIVTMDADLSHDPLDLDKFIEKSKEADIVIGSRHIANSLILGWGFYRYFIHHIANLVAKFILLIKCSDIPSGYRLYKREAFRNVIKYVKSKGFSFQIETLFIAKRLGYRIKEVPITFIDRKIGKSKFNIKEIIEFLLTIFRLIKRSKQII